MTRECKEQIEPGFVKIEEVEGPPGTGAKAETGRCPGIVGAQFGFLTRVAHAGSMVFKESMWLKKKR
jgi:hypothetical protein